MKSRAITAEKVEGDKNPADLMTKAVPKAKLDALLAMLGLAAGDWWVDHAVTNFIDLHHNYAAFTPQDYAAWFALVIGTMASRAGPDWPAGASAAWQRQADALVAKVATVTDNSAVPVRA